MYLHHLKIAWRNLLRNKTFSLINISGFTIGITVSLLIFVYVNDELKYDTHFSNEHVYRLYGNNFNGKNYGANQPARFTEEILKRIPEVEKGVRLNFNSSDIKVHDLLYKESMFAYADTTVFDVLEIDLIRGNATEALRDPFNVVISKSTSELLFGDGDPFGKTIYVDKENEFTVNGIFEDLPHHSHLQLNFIASMSTHRQVETTVLDHWGNFGTYQYYTLHPEADPAKTQEKITDLWIKTDKPQLGNISGDIQLKLLPYKNIYLNSTGIGQSDNFKSGNIYSLTGFSIIAVLILFIACFNFLNLTTAKMSLKGKEVGIRKSIGARKNELIKQYLSESFFFVLISMSLAIVLIEIFFSEFNRVLQTNIPVESIHSLEFLLFIILVTVFTALGAGFYPALLLSNFSPALIIKGSSNVTFRPSKKSHGFVIKNMLVFGQFFIAISLIMGTIFIARQIQYLRNSDVGFNREKVVAVVNPWDKDMYTRYERLKNEVSQMPEISSFGSGTNVPPDGIWNFGYPHTVSEDLWVEQVGFISVGYNYFKTLDAEILEGRDFNPGLSSDSSSLIVNEAFAKETGDPDILGKVFRGFWDGKDRTVIGVVKDIHFNSAHNEVKPCAFFMSKNLPSVVHILLRLNSENFGESLKNIEHAWTKAAPDWPFSYFFLDDKFEAAYNKEVKTEKLLKAFSLLAIFLCMIGIGGLALFTTQNKFKEIGIRKLLGASVSQIMILLSKDFLIWGLLAFTVSCPIVYYLLNIWLQEFAYKITLDWWVFVYSGGISLVIALIVICIQIIKSARANPVEALRYE